VAELERRPLGEGAAQAAPTAPHATPRAKGGRRNGPERFWAAWPVRIALGVSLVASGLAHCAMVPVEVPKSFEVDDVEGVAAIPIDVFEEKDTPPPPAEPPPESKAPADSTRGPDDPALASSRRDGGAPEDAALDAAGDAAPADARADGSGLDGAVAAATDAGPSSSGPRDPEAILGAAGDIQADKVLVMVVVNGEVIRKNPEGASIGALLRGVPQWNDFMNGTAIDPVRDTDWLMISGPSLANTSRDVVLVRYGAPDAVVDRAVDALAAKYAKGGAFDAGVPQVRAVRSFADNAERVVLRPQSHVLAVVPPSVATKVAKQLLHATVPPHIRKGEAMYLRVFDPHHPMPEIPQSITEMRMRIVPREDDGADVFLDGDTKDADTAAQASREVRAVIDRHNDMFVSMATHGLLDRVEVGPEGNVVRVHLVATRDQIATVVKLVAAMVGVGSPGGGAEAPKPAPRGSQ
jgi:hypothetical protein